jgi:hypothetical protein
MDRTTAQQSRSDIRPTAGAGPGGGVASAEAEIQLAVRRLARETCSGRSVTRRGQRRDGNRC